MYDLAEQAGSSELVQAGVTGCTKKSVEKKSEESRVSSTRIMRWLRTAGHPVHCVRIANKISWSQVYRPRIESRKRPLLSAVGRRLRQPNAFSALEQKLTTCSQH